jgi:hypothetical protein
LNGDWGKDVCGNVERDRRGLWDRWIDWDLKDGRLEAGNGEISAGLLF